MSQMSVTQAFQQAVSHHQGGNIPAAKDLYRRIVEAVPQHSDAWHHLGLIAAQENDFPRALELINKAIALVPTCAAYHSNLGEVNRRAGNIEEGLIHLRKALSLQENLPDAYNNLGLALITLRRYDEARDAFLRLVELLPQSPNAHTNLGDAYMKLRQFDTAIAQYHKALALQPNWTNALNNLGTCYVELNRLDDAEAAFTAAVNAEPNDEIALTNLTNMAFRRRNFVLARRAYEHFLARHPKSLEARRGLAGVLRETTHYDESLALFRETIAMYPQDAYLRANLGATLRDAGYHREALEELDRARKLAPEEAPIHSAYILSLYLLPETTQQIVDAEKSAWDERHARPLMPNSPAYPQSPDPERVLKIGYISNDLRVHPVGRFMLPLIRAHDPARVNITCYSTNVASDEYTRNIKAALAASGGKWFDADLIDTDRLAQRVAADQIDVLVDLCMHAAGNRLQTFAQRPAPVQVSYLAYADSAGIAAIDAHLTDALLQPPPDPDLPFDRPLRLPHTYWCYAPPAEAGDVTPLPALHGKPFTFGCFNHFAKLTLPTLAAWAELLRRAPACRLLLHVPPGQCRTLVLSRFAAVGAPQERIDFVPSTSLRGYLEYHARVDAALDPFPYTGGTTTCDALWMGVPVITLAGPPETPGVSRSGLSILTTLGLQHLAARSTDEYVTIAAGLMNDLPALAALRAGLRGRMSASPLTDIKAFARDIEDAYRTLWRNWCASRNAP